MYYSGDPYPDPYAYGQQQNHHHHHHHHNSQPEYGSPQPAYVPPQPEYPSPSHHHHHHQGSSYSQYPPSSGYTSYAPDGASYNNQYAATSSYPPASYSSAPQYPPPSQYGAPTSSYNAPYPGSPSYGGSTYAAGSYPPPRYGNKRALVVGINYFGNSEAQLNGCVHDAEFLKYLLMSKYGVQEQSIVVLTDKASGPASQPTKSNMLNEMRRLVQGAQPGDSLFFSFSGHGGQVKDQDGDESDGFDETILPVDYKTAGQIIDDDLHDILAKPLPPGCKLTCVMDCCHSGTGLDLPYTYDRRGGAPTVENRRLAQKQTVADVILYSGCQDNQTAADAKQSGVASGVLSFAFCKAIESHGNLSYSTLLEAMHTYSREKGYTQIIQFSSGKPFDINQSFII